MIRGSCLCGAIRFEMDRVAGPFELCHCSRCRKTSGSGYLAGVGVKTSDFRFIAGKELIVVFELPVRDRPPGYRRPFCRICGSVVPEPEPSGELCEVPAGLLDDEPGLVPDRHIFVDYGATWTPRGDGLPALTEHELLALRAAEAATS